MKTHLRLFLTMVVLCLTAVCADAAAYTVTNTGNDGPGSLRAAIAAANSTPDDDTIGFNIPASDGNCVNARCTITLAGNFGFRELTVDPAGSLSIAAAPTANKIVINGNSGSRVIQINGGANLTLNNLIITGGLGSFTSVDPANGGGGIYNNNGTVNLINTDVSGNSSGGSNIPGGGVTNLGLLTLNHSNISGNNAGFGGGIENRGTLIIADSSISDNSNGDNGNGGGIDNSGILSVANSTVSGNISSTGGGIFSSNTVTIVNSTVANNTGVFGPGIDNLGSLTVAGSLISGNHDTEDDSTFNAGGGILNESNAVATIANSTVTGNYVQDNAGGIANGGTMTIANSTIAHNLGRFIIDGAGVAVADGGTLYLRNTIIAENFGFENSPSDVCNYATAISNGNNLVQNDTCGGISWQSTDILGQSPRFAPLGNYGGATQTIALTNGSPAINNGNNCVVNANGCGDNNPALPADARGAARVGNVDIGAFELNNLANGGTFPAVTTAGNITLPYYYLLTSDSGAFSYSLTAGSLPPGLSLNNASVLKLATQRMSTKKPLAPTAGGYSITGTPTTGGTFNYTITATDGTDSVSTNYRTAIFALPTAAGVDLSGRVLSGITGLGIPNARVLLTDQTGQTRTAPTNPFGAFRFADVPAGATYVLTVTAKRFEFAPQVIAPFGSLNGLILTSENEADNVPSGR